ncbi:MAG: hypothetical protein AB7U20_16020 [Planctomycetaceae bacterium]
MTRSRTQFAVQVLATGIALLATIAPAGAQVTKPFKIKGGGVAPEGLRPPGEVTTHLIEGTATHLGKHTGVGTFDIYTFAPDDPVSPTFFSGTFGSHDPCVFVGANGDELVCYYGRPDKGASDVGTYVLTIVGATGDGAPIVVGDFYAEFVVQPESTGKFAGATGSWIMHAQTDPFVLGSSDPVNYQWNGETKLTFNK